MKKSPVRWISYVFFLSLGLFGGAILGCGLLIAVPQDTIPSGAESNFRLIAEAWNMIQRVYVDRNAVNPQRITYGAIGGMVDALGDTGHSRFLTPEMLKQERNLTKGRFEGIGAEVQMKNGQLVIVAPIDGSPAQKAGLKPGDIVLKVDDQDVSGLSLDRAVDRILGPAGTRVKLTILNLRTNTTKEITLTRASIDVQSVAWHPLPGTKVAHLRIATFSKGVAENLRKALLALEKEGATGLILDLRNNPGGLYNEAVSSASQFLSGGNVLLEKNAVGKITPVPVRPGGVAVSLPLIVLINGGTSSGAEIVAGALKDAHRAELVGEKTFGTGTVLETFPLSDGSALMLAVEEWLTPAGTLIWHHGIVPDVPIPLPPEVTPLIPSNEKGLTAEELRNSKDVQLLRALDLLLRPQGPHTRENPKERFAHDIAIHESEWSDNASPGPI